MNDSPQPPPGNGAGVVLLHGFAAFPGVMWPLARRLRRMGYAVLTPYYPSWLLPLDANIARLEPQVGRFAERLNGPVHFVGHSMGGLMIRALLARYRPPRLGRVVLLGTPNAGSEIADYFLANPLLQPVLGQAAPLLVTRRERAWLTRLGKVDYPLGIIAGGRCGRFAPYAHVLPTPHDGKVAVSATHVDGQADHIVLPLTHSGLCFDPRVARPVGRFLEHGRFASGTVDA